VSGLVMNNECDMGRVYRVIIMNNQLGLHGPIGICIPSYRHNDISIAVTDD
jgi:hypothetical protein